MGYDAYARLMIGVPVRRNQLFTTKAVSATECPKGHPLSSPPTKHCPECGAPIAAVKMVEEPTPKLAAWLTFAGMSGVHARNVDAIWEFLRDKAPFKVFPADNRVNSEQQPSSYAFGRQVMKDVGPESTVVGHHGPLPGELVLLMEQVKASAAMAGIEGEPRLFVQLHESF